MRTLLWFTTCLIIGGCAVLMPWQTASTIPEKVEEGIYRGPRPDFGKLSTLGVNTVISLEDDISVIDAERAEAQNHQMFFVNISLSESESPTPETLRFIASNIEHFRATQVYVHCRRGVDRTGYAIASWQILYAGWSFDRAYQEILAHGHSEIYFRAWKLSLEQL